MKLWTVISSLLDTLFNYTSIISTEILPLYFKSNDGTAWWFLLKFLLSLGICKSNRVQISSGIIRILHLVYFSYNVGYLTLDLNRVSLQWALCAIFHFPGLPCLRFLTTGFFSFASKLVSQKLAQSWLNISYSFVDASLIHEAAGSDRVTHPNR